MSNNKFNALLIKSWGVFMNFFKSILIAMVASFIGLQPCSALNRRASTFSFLDQTNLDQTKSSSQGMKSITSFKEKFYLSPSLVNAIQSQVDFFKQQAEDMFKVMGMRSAATRLLLTPRGINRAFTKEKYRSLISADKQSFLNTITSKMRFSGNTAKELERFIKAISQDTLSLKKLIVKNEPLPLATSIHSGTDSLLQNIGAQEQMHYNFDSLYSISTVNVHHKHVSTSFLDSYHDLPEWTTLSILKIIQLLI